MSLEQEAEKIINKEQARIKITDMLEECFSLDPRGLEKDALTQVLIDLGKDIFTPEQALKKAQEIYNLWEKN